MRKKRIEQNENKNIVIIIIIYNIYNIYHVKLTKHNNVILTLDSIKSSTYT